MKAINEIRLKLCALLCCILIPLFSDNYPSGSGWTGFCNIILISITGVVLGCFITNFLIVF